MSFITLNDSSMLLQVDIFLNYDCDIHEPRDIFERMVNDLSGIAKGRGLSFILCSINEWSDKSTYFVQTQLFIYIYIDLCMSFFFRQEYVSKYIDSNIYDIYIYIFFVRTTTAPSPSVSAVQDRLKSFHMRSHQAFISLRVLGMS